MTGTDGTVHPFPVVEVAVPDVEALMAMVHHGFSVRTTAATGVHDASSRSHAILRIYIHEDGTDSQGGGYGRVGDGSVSEGVLNLVDLAGSEHRIDSMYHTAARRKEGSQINASLMALKSIVHARAAGQNVDHIYRKSKLTMALKSSFMNPNALTVVIATVSPAAKDTEHSLNTLRHACVMDGMKNARLRVYPASRTAQHSTAQHSTAEQSTQRTQCSLLSFSLSLTHTHSNISYLAFPGQGHLKGNTSGKSSKSSSKSVTSEAGGTVRTVTVGEVNVSNHVRRANAGKGDDLGDLTRCVVVLFQMFSSIQSAVSIMSVVLFCNIMCLAIVVKVSCSRILFLSCCLDLLRACFDPCQATATRLAVRVCKATLMTQQRLKSNNKRSRRGNDVLM
jgi:hypothetical protein